MPQRASNVGIGWDDDDDLFDPRADGVPPQASAPARNENRKSSSPKGMDKGAPGFLQRMRQGSSRRTGPEEWGSEEQGRSFDDEHEQQHQEDMEGGGGVGTTARVSGVTERPSGKSYDIAYRHNGNCGRYLAIFMALTIIVGVAVGAYFGKVKSDEENDQRAKDAEILQDIIDNRTEKPTPSPTTLTPTMPPVDSTTLTKDLPTSSTPPVAVTSEIAKPEPPPVPVCEEGLVVHRISLRGGTDDPSLWATSTGQIRTLVMQIRDAEWGDLLYQKGFRHPEEVDYTCLNLYDAMQELSFQSGCYEVSLSWFIPGVGVEMPEEGGVRWRIEPVEGQEPNMVPLGIVPYSQDRTTTCTIRTSIEEGFFQCLPNCAQASQTAGNESGGGRSGGIFATP